MKLGVMTFHQALNYGAALQTYGLQQYIRRNLKDVEIEVVDYRCPELSRLYSTAHQRSGNPVKTLIKTGHFLLKRRHFQKFFQKHIRCSSRSYTPENIGEAVPLYDKFIVGSDQVWNPDLTNGDRNYLLEFAPAEKRYAYAASVGRAALPQETQQAMCRLLADFQGLSLREASGAQMLKAMGLTRPVSVHIDPVLLLERKHWEALAAGVPPRKKGYVLVFTVAKSQALVDQAVAFAKAQGLEVLYIGQHIRDSRVQYIPFLALEKLIALFRDSDYVFTNSFHGTVLSLLFHRKFYAQAQDTDGRASRITDLLKKLELTARMDETALDDLADWNRVDAILAEQRQLAGAYLEWIAANEN